LIARTAASSSAASSRCRWAVRRAGQIDASAAPMASMSGGRACRHDLHRPARGDLCCMRSVVTTGLAGIAATILFRSELGLVSLAVREIICVSNISGSRQPCGHHQLQSSRIFAGASGAFALMAQRHIDPQFRLLDHVRRIRLRGGARRLSKACAAVFVASLALETGSLVLNLYLPNTWQLVLGVFLLGVILFLPRGIGSL